MGGSRESQVPWYQSYIQRRIPWMVTIIESSIFEVAIGNIIIFHCISIGMKVHFCPPLDSPRFIPAGCPERFLSISENMCTAIFVLEFFIRGLVMGFKYHLQTGENIFDAVLVWITGVLFTWVMPLFVTTSRHMRWLTALRAFRLLRILRVVRHSQLFKEMWLLVKGLTQSAPTVISAVVVSVFVNYLFGILAVLLIGDSPSPEGDDQEVFEEHFYGLDRSMFTLLQIATGDGWATEVARPVMHVLPEMWIYFVVYIAVAVLVLLNLITAIIVENALAMTKNSEAEQLMILKHQKAEEFEKLKTIFTSLDTDKSGLIHEEEFESAFKNCPEILDKFKLLDFEEAEILGLFRDLDSGDSVLSLEEFIEGLASMQGDAKSKDLVRTKKSMDRLHKRIDKILDFLEDGTHNMPRTRRNSKQEHSSTPPSVKAGKIGESSVAASSSSEQDVPEIAMEQRALFADGPPPLSYEGASGKFSNVQIANRNISPTHAGKTTHAEAVKNNPTNHCAEAGKNRFVKPGDVSLQPHERDFVIGALPEPGSVARGGDVITALCDSVRSRLHDRLVEAKAHMAEVCRAELARQLKANLNVVNQKLAPVDCGSQDFVADAVAPLALPAWYDEEVQALVFEHLGEVKRQVADVCCMELARHFAHSQSTSKMEETLDASRSMSPAIGISKSKEGAARAGGDRARAELQQNWSPRVHLQSEGGGGGGGNIPVDLRRPPDTKEKGFFTMSACSSSSCG
eukprot:gnl/MRDRNA2_/MRDRNA2_70340_c0_seq1.p1 gnl/MRDRNA2_/MRDRNA2_70340_c0~~gnl/MRDRNA2_/MRDRNA2_70340_c0_seq1.p1  ORF type:complete len:740 (-),score=139.80 gnl/MRDRNA2_/MRDRNA2_70340_c0_seq1:301-2520(-)